MNCVFLTRIKFSYFLRIATFGSLCHIISQVPLALAYDCDRYCFASCSEYFEARSGEFSECVSANVHCSCTTKFSFKNPLMIFLFILFIIISCFCSGLCYWFCRQRSASTPHNRVIAHPIVTNNTETLFQTSAPYTYPASQQSYNFPVAAPTTPLQCNGIGTNNHHSLFTESTKTEISSEYSAPPPYNDCVINANTGNY